MKTLGSSETTVLLYHTKDSNILEGISVNIHCLEHLESHRMYLFRYKLPYQI